MKRTIAFAIICLAMAGFAPQVSTAATYDALADFNDTGIQPGAGNPWTYGTETALNSGFALLPNFKNTICSAKGCSFNLVGGSVDNYFKDYTFSGASVAKVVSGTILTTIPDTGALIPNNVVVMLAGSADYNTPNLVVTRFTAPNAGLFSVSGSFSDLQKASVNLAVVVNGFSQFNSSFAGSSLHQGTIPFSLNDVSLAQGATIDFVVDSLGDQSFDALGLNAQIIDNTDAAATVGAPGPIAGAGFPGLLAGFGAMLAWYRKRRAAI